METILHFYPRDHETYLHILTHLTPILDREGLSFHIARPGEPDPCQGFSSMGISLEADRERGCCQ